MIQLSTVLWGMVILFAIIGFSRGWTKEIIALTGVVLALFTLEQFKDVFLAPLTAGAQPAQQLYLYGGILLLITFFAYQTPDRFQQQTKKSRRSRGGNLQESLLGAMIGGFNGYLVFGSLWYYMRDLGYPLAPNIPEPFVGTASAAMQLNLPLDWLLEGNLLTLLVVVLFLFVIVVLI
jgi:hypothetical protein